MPRSLGVRASAKGRTPFTVRDWFQSVKRFFRASTHLAVVGRQRYAPRMDLVGVHEIAKILGVSRQRVDAIVRGGAFPSPVCRIAAGRIWRRTDIVAWAKAHRPRPSRIIRRKVS